LHTLKILFADDCLMRIADADPFLLRERDDRLIFVAGFPEHPLHHVAGVHFVLQDTAHGFIAPQDRFANRAGLEIQPRLAFVVGGVRDAAFIERSHNGAHTGAVQVHPIDESDDFSRFLVDQQFVTVGGIFFVAVLGEGAHEQTAAALHVEGRADALGVGGDVVFVDHAAHGVVEKVDGDALALAGVDGVIHGDVAHLQAWKNLAEVAAAFTGVATEAGAVLDDDAVDLLRVDVRHHAQEVGAVEARAGVAVVDVAVMQFDVRLVVDEVRQQTLLIDDRVGFGFVAVLAREANIKSSPVGSRDPRRLLCCSICGIG